MQPIEIALEAALLVMRSGGSTVAAERSFTAILRGCHQPGIEAVWRLDFIAAADPAVGKSSAVVRPVGPIGVNLVRASEVAVLGERVASGEVDGAAVGAEVRRIAQLPSPHNRWVMTAAAAIAAASFSQLPGGDWGSVGVAFVAAGVGQSLRSLLQARKLAVAPVTLVCGLLSALIASVGLRLGVSQVAPATLIASVIYMVPSLPLINGFVDMLSHRHLLVGVGRMINAAYLFLLLTIAIAFAHAVVL